MATTSRPVASLEENIAAYHDMREELEEYQLRQSGWYSITAELIGFLLLSSPMPPTEAMEAFGR